MSTGMLSNWYLSKIRKSRTPVEYFFALHAYLLYEANLISYNIKNIFNR